jgi:hypothetical protein
MNSRFTPTYVDRSIWSVLAAAVAWWLFHPLAENILEGSPSSVSRLIDSLYLPFSVTWALFLVYFMNKPSMSPEAGLLFAAVVGALDAVLLGARAIAMDASPVLSVLAGLITAALAVVALSGWLSWWFRRGGRERLTKSPGLRRGEQSQRSSLSRSPSV